MLDSAIRNLRSHRPEPSQRGVLGPIVVPLFVAALSIFWCTLWFHSLFAGVVSWHWLAALAALNLWTLLVYRHDKRAALRGALRISEAHLNTLAVLGGWPAAYVAQILFRHKTRKPRFQLIYWSAAFVNLMAAALLSSADLRSMAVAYAQANPLHVVAGIICAMLALVVGIWLLPESTLQLRIRSKREQEAFRPIDSTYHPRAFRRRNRS